ncbi:MAG TPA: hypothetical protein VL443_24180 [Cyclobacteriaceae bacterium]|jgi:hypothetical protein|nr:hypothetical protein [Cyclobacteriaceae bacterium]
MAKKDKISSIISLRALCEKAEIIHHRVYHALKGTHKSSYKPLEHIEKTKLANTIYNEITPMLKALGFGITIHRIKDPTLEP